MKKYVQIILLTCCSLFILTGCGSNNDSKSTSNQKYLMLVQNDTDGFIKQIMDAAKTQAQNQGAELTINSAP